MIKERWKNLMRVLGGPRPVERALSVTVQKLMADLAAADKENRRLTELTQRPWPECCLEAENAEEKIQKLEAALKVAAERLHHFGYVECAKQARTAMGYSDV